MPRGKAIDLRKLPKAERERIMKRREATRQWVLKNRPPKSMQIPTQNNSLNGTQIDRLEVLVRELKETRTKASLLIREIRDLTQQKEAVA